MAVRGKNSLFFATGIDNTGLEAGLDQAANLVTGLGSTISKINPFAALAIGALSAFGIIAQSAFKLAKEFETAMKEVETISEATRSDFNGIAAEVFALSTITPEEPKKLAEAYYQIVSAGYDGAQGMKLLETSAKAAIAGVTDTETAADGITTVMNAFGVSMKDVDLVADGMFKTVELGKTTFSQLAGSMSTVAPLASALGLDFQEIFAAVATLTKQGVPTAQAMTQIRAALIGVNEVLGDGWGNAYTLQDALVEVERQAGGSQTELKRLLGSVEAVSAVLGIAGKNAKGAAEDLDNLSKSSGAVERAFRSQLGSNENQWKLLSNRIKAATHDLGNFVLDASTGLAKVLNSMAKDYDTVSKSMGVQSVKLGVLRNEILQTNTTEERRAAIIKELKQISPDYLGLLDLETLGNKELADAIQGANDKLVDQIVLQKSQEKITESADKTAEAKIELLERERLTRESIYKLERRFGVEATKTSDVIADMLSLEKELLGVTGENKSAAESWADVIAGQRTIVGNLRSDYYELNQETDKLVNKKIKITAELGLDKTNDVDEKFTNAIQEKLKLIATLNNSDDLQIYLADGNELVRKSAQERIDILEKAKSKYKEDFDAWKQSLTDKAKAYEKYESLIKTLGEAEAESFKSKLGIQEETFSEYLKKLYDETQSTSQKIEIALVAAASGININRTPEQKVDTVTKSIKQNVDISVDVTDESINNVKKKIEEIQIAFDKSNSQIQRDALKLRQAQYEDALVIMKNEKESEIEEKEDMYNSVGDLGIRALAERLKRHKSLMKDLLKNEKENAEKIEKLKLDISAEEQAMGEKAVQIAGEISNIFGSLSDLFNKFGNEDLGNLLGQLEGVAAGAGTLAKGIATSDPFAIIAGSLDILKSAITVDIVSDTSKFEKAIDVLKKSIDKLDYAISRSIGDERISNRKEAIDQLKELEQAAKDAEQAELKARKEVNFLGLTLGKKDDGSGTDPEKILELQEAAEEARREVQALNDEIDQIFTGTTSANIVNALVEGFQQGKKSAKDFSETFEQLMKDAVIESLKVKFLERATEDFFKDFADSAESGGGLDSQEIDSLRSTFASIVETSNRELEALNQILGDAGITAGVGIDGQNAQGLAGEITTITEDTANVLASTMNGIRLDVYSGLQVAIESNLYLSQINLNIVRLVQETEISNIRLTSIERNLQ